MTRYYLIIASVNLIFVLSYLKFYSTSFSKRTIFLITGLSTVIGLAFPNLLIHLRLASVLNICFILLVIGSLGIVFLENRENKAEEIEDYDEVEVVNNLTEVQTASSAHQVTPGEKEYLYSDTKYITEETASNEETEIEIADASAEVDAEANFDADVDVDSNVDIDANIDADVDIDSNDNASGEDMSDKDNKAEQNITSINDYINKAFEAKFSAQYELAVEYFLEALKLDPPMELANLIVFDVSAMMKEIGQYNMARECLEHFLDKYQGLLSVNVVREAAVTTKYLELLEEKLIKANTPNLPFSKVPAIIKFSVDEKVSHWKKDFGAE